jgi:hypothetical protein
VLILDSAGAKSRDASGDSSFVNWLQPDRPGLAQNERLGKAVPLEGRANYRFCPKSERESGSPPFTSANDLNFQQDLRRSALPFWSAHVRFRVVLEPTRLTSPTSSRRWAGFETHLGRRPPSRFEPSFKILKCEPCAEPRGS